MYKHKYVKFIQIQLLFIFPLRCVCFAIDLNETDTEHLKLDRVKELCAEKNIICKSSPRDYLCTIRVENGKLKTKDFESYCSFFLVNMCDCPGNEWAIKESGSCQSVNLRRYQQQIENVTYSNDVENLTGETTTATDGEGEAVTEGDEEAVTEGEKEAVTEGDEEAVTEGDEEAVSKREGDAAIEGDAATEGEGDNATKTEDVPNATGEEAAVSNEVDATTVVPALRNIADKKYSVDYAPDDHKCPLFCTDLYSPVCVNINRSFGQYYKLLFFVNHCEADRHYCLYWDTEYTPPPDYEYEMVNSPSNAAWSYCAASKYMNFATFAESASSLGHYGWLRGSQRPEHIMEPWERVRGYG